MRVSVCVCLCACARAGAEPGAWRAAGRRPRCAWELGTRWDPAAAAAAAEAARTLLPRAARGGLHPGRSAPTRPVTPRRCRRRRRWQARPASSALLLLLLLLRSLQTPTRQPTTGRRPPPWLPAPGPAGGAGLFLRGLRGAALGRPPLPASPGVSAPRAFSLRGGGHLAPWSPPSSFLLSASRQPPRPDPEWLPRPLY